MTDSSLDPSAIRSPSPNKPERRLATPQSRTKAFASHRRTYLTPQKLPIQRKSRPLSRTPSEEHSFAPDLDHRVSAASRNMQQDQVQAIEDYSVSRESSQYARDLRRVDYAMGNHQAFSKAGNRGPVSAEKARNRHLRMRNDGYSSGSRTSPDLSLNVPAAWGKMSRPDPEPKLPKGKPFVKAAQEKELDGWLAAAADTPLPSDRKARFPFSNATGMHGSAPASPEKPPEWTIHEDFTVPSIQVSTSPPVPVRNVTLDRLRNRLHHRAAAVRQDPSPIRELPGAHCEESPGVQKSPDISADGQRLDDSGAHVTPKLINGNVQPKQLSAMKTPVVTGAWTDVVTPSLLNVDASVNEKKTPFVMGGWIDTPAPRQHENPSMPMTVSKEELSDAGVTETNAIHENAAATVPRSALSSVLQRLKDPEKQATDDLTLQLGEATMQSLEELVLRDDDPASTDLKDEDSQSLVQPGPSPELHSYAQILARLTNLGPSLRDSRKQLTSLERALGDSNDKPTLPSNDGSSVSFSPFLFIISTADNDLLASTLLIRVPLPRICTWPSKAAFPRPTWFGVMCAIFWILILAEIWARRSFCHPLYAPMMHGFGVDIHAPEPPFVLAQLLWRSVRPSSTSWTAMILRLFRKCVRFTLAPAAALFSLAKS